MKYGRCPSNATHQFLDFFFLFVAWNYGIKGDENLLTGHKTVLFAVYYKSSQESVTQSVP